MKNFGKNIIVVCSVAVLSFTLLAAPVMAAGENQGRPGADAMLADAVFLRPLGLVSSLFGTAVFIVTLPFSIPGGNAGAAGQRLVGDPLQYTFGRPLGEINR